MELQRQLPQQQPRRADVPPQQRLPALRSSGDSAAPAAAPQHCSKCSLAAFCSPSNYKPWHEHICMHALISSHPVRSSTGIMQTRSRGPGLASACQSIYPLYVMLHKMTNSSRPGAKIHGVLKTCWQCTHQRHEGGHNVEAALVQCLHQNDYNAAWAPKLIPRGDTCRQQLAE